MRSVKERRMYGRSPALSTLIAGFVLAGGLLVVLSQTAQAANVDESRIRQAVTAHARDRMHALFPAEKPECIAVTPIAIPPSPLNFPHLASTDDVRITTESRMGESYSERSLIKVRLETPDGEVREMGVPVRMIIRKPVWVVKNTITANTPLQASDFSLETRDVSHNYRYVAGAEKNPAGYAARVNLWPGETLDVRKIIIPPDVVFNGEVRILIANANGMTLTVPGIALSSGRIGEIIRVRQTVFQRKYYNAKVIDRNRVLVEI